MHKKKPGVACLFRRPLRVDKVKGGRVSVVQDQLQLDLGLAFRRDLLVLDVGVLVVDGEGVALVAHHPGDPLAHDVQRALVLLVLDMRHLQQNVLGRTTHG